MVIHNMSDGVAHVPLSWSIEHYSSVGPIVDPAINCQVGASWAESCINGFTVVPRVDVKLEGLSAGIDCWWMFKIPSVSFAKE